MLDIFGNKQTSLVGIDIGSSSVRVMELEESHAQFKIVSYGTQPLPKDIFEGKQIKNPDKLIDVIKEALFDANTKTNQVAVAVPDSNVITKVIQLDKELAESEREELVVLEADKHIPYPIDEVSLDYEILGPSEKSPRRDNILVVASRTEHVNERVELMRGSGLKTKVVDVESYVVERVCQLFADEMPNEGKAQRIAVFDIGEIYTKLTVLDDLKAVFSREETFGFNQLTEELSRRYDIPPHQVGELKRHGKLPEDAETEVFEPFKEMIGTQIKRALQFYASAADDNHIDQILLFGGASSLPGLTKVIEHQLEIPTKIINPVSKMAVHRRVDVTKVNEDSSALLLALGLALRKFE